MSTAHHQGSHGFCGLLYPISPNSSMSVFMIELSAVSCPVSSLGICQEVISVSGISATDPACLVRTEHSPAFSVMQKKTRRSRAAISPHYPSSPSRWSCGALTDLGKDPSTPLQGHEAGTHKLFYVGFHILGDSVLQGRKHITKLQLCESTQSQKSPHTPRVWLVLTLPWLPEGQPMPARARALAVPSQALGIRAVLTSWTAGLHPPLKVLSIFLH